MYVELQTDIIGKEEEDWGAHMFRCSGRQCLEEPAAFSGLSWRYKNPKFLRPAKVKPLFFNQGKEKKVGNTNVL